MQACHVIATCDSPAQYITYNMSVPSSTNMDVHTNHYLSMHAVLTLYLLECFSLLDHPVACSYRLQLA